MFKRFALPALLALSAPAAAQTIDAVIEVSLVPVVLETSMGDIKVEVQVERAPVTAANFLRYVDEGRLDGTVFYRAMRLDWGDQPNGLVQAGTQNDPDRILPPIAHERTSDTGLSHLRGALSMARYEPGTATGDFSIMLQDQPGMDAKPSDPDPQFHDGYAVFGFVTEGMEVVEAIHAAPVDPEAGEGWMKGQMLAEPVRIVRAHRAE
jgi:peptidyl-prolyl cis-trans isomerase A (cyclophilin A)